MKNFNSQFLLTLMLAIVFCFATSCETTINVPTSETDSKKNETSEANTANEKIEKEDAEPKEDSETEKEAVKKEEANDTEDDQTTEETTKSVEKSSNNNPTVIKFDKGKTSKTLNVMLKGDQNKKFSLDVGKGQVINVSLQGEGGKSASINLINGKDGVDNWEDGFGYLSILSGRKGTFIIGVSSQNGKDLTFPMKFSVTNNPDDYEGGVTP